MVFISLCPPALIYLIFSVTQIVIDTVKGLYNTAIIKIWVAIIFTILLNYLCQIGLGIISWLIVFIPFVLMTLIVAILLFMFGLDPKTGKIKIKHTHQCKKGEKCKKHHHKKDDTEKKDASNVLDYYNMQDGGGGGASSTNDTGSLTVEEDETEVASESKQEKTDRILNRSLLFYSDQIVDNTNISKGKKKKGESNESDYTLDKNYLDTNKYKASVEKISNVLYGMGEQEIAVYYKNKCLECINSVEGMTLEKKKDSITKCHDNIMKEIMSKLNGETLDKFKMNVEASMCETNQTFANCTKELDKSWW